MLTFRSEVFYICPARVYTLLIKTRKVNVSCLWEWNLVSEFEGETLIENFENKTLREIPRPRKGEMREQGKLCSESLIICNFPCR